jgi:hypothetical protein
MSTLGLTNNPEPAPASVQSDAYLFNCVACSKAVSSNAASCPSCGHVYNLKATYIRPGAGWSWAVAGGIFLFWIIPFLIGSVIFIIIFALGLIGAVAGRAK